MSSLLELTLEGAVISHSPSWDPVLTSDCRCCLSLPDCLSVLCVVGPGCVHFECFCVVRRGGVLLKWDGWYSPATTVLEKGRRVVISCWFSNISVLRSGAKSEAKLRKHYPVFSSFTGGFQVYPQNTRHLAQNSLRLGSVPKN